MLNILQEISESKVKEKVKGFIITHENMDKDFERYNYGFLDIFDHCLNEEEADNLLNSFSEHNMRYEHKFIEFMKLAYELNDNEPIIMNLPFHELESAFILNILNMLDYVDRVLFIDQLRRLNIQGQYYQINHYDLLELYTKLATRELYFPIFHFTKYPMTFVGHYDLSFPVFCQDADNMTKYKIIAEKCGLHIRDIALKDF